MTPDIDQAIELIHAYTVLTAIPPGTLVVPVGYLKLMLKDLAGIRGQRVLVFAPAMKLERYLGVSIVLDPFGTAMFAGGCPDTDALIPLESRPYTEVDCAEYV